VAPRTPVEETLAGIWAEVLKIDRVGVHDNFFELGGHSLLATQLVHRVRTDMTIDIPLKMLFEHPSIADLSTQLDIGLKASMSARLLDREGERYEEGEL
jgi:surfactin family lipopeptide synthetase A